jgi:hypothetical protein
LDGFADVTNDQLGCIRDFPDCEDDASMSSSFLKPPPFMGNILPMSELSTDTPAMAVLLVSVADTG